MATSRNSRLVWTIPLLIAVCFIRFPAQAQYGGGTGEPNDPYQIYTAEQVNAIGAEPNDWDKQFKLMADLNLTGMNINRIGAFYYDKEDNLPFTGVFDGNGRTIANFKPPEMSFGLFEYVSGPYAEIRDLILIDPNVHGADVGSLVGRFVGGTIRDCTVVDGHVSGIYGDYTFSNVGGLIGVAIDGVIEDCFSSASVSVTT